MISVHTGADPIRDKYKFDVDIPRSHELKYKRSAKASFVYEISLIPYLQLFFWIRSVGSHGSQMDRSSVLFIRTSLVRITEPNWRR